jgi:ABC-type multidrug transport system fused ATPase/permease subunit
MVTRKEKVTSKAIEILKSEPNGLRSKEIVKKIEEELQYPHGTVTGTVWRLGTLVPDKIYKPETGRYRHVMFKDEGFGGEVGVKVEPPPETEKRKEKDLRVGNLYFENKEQIIRQITAALKNGKHIILIGPPGTGKSKLAKKICDSYCGRGGYTMTTATSDWSTFDTIGGYVQDENGKLKFSPGVFLKC